MSDRVSVVASTSREKILEAAERLFGDCGYEDVPVSDLYREAGVSRATFYRIFAAKSDVYEVVRGEGAPAQRSAIDRVREGSREAFGQFGYDDVKVDHMIAAAGVARSTFYRFFKDKAAAMKAYKAGKITMNTPVTIKKK